MKVPVAAATVTATYRAATADVVQLSSHRNNGPISDQGATVFGTVAGVANVETLTAVIGTTNRRAPLEFDPASGRFALRLFIGEITTGQPVALTFERKDKAGLVATSGFTLTGAAIPASLQQVLGRLTFGATPALLNNIGTVGYSTWVEQQLNPAAIDDSSLATMNPEAILRKTDDPWRLKESIPMWQMAFAAYSERQLQEVMTVFWNNHFWSTDTDWNANMSDVDEINGFRRNALGKFRDLLAVSSKSPQMMFFLDNQFSRRNNINENYARELLEVHTVGVNGGYGDADIIAVARVLTGWQATRTSADGVNPVIYKFEFKPDQHDTAAKTIPFLNMTIAARAGAAGEQEGDELLDALARHPKTREFVCGKIVELLVSDARPAAFVNLCATTWASTDGDIKQILRAILLDPTYLTTVDFQRSKSKTPFEYVTGFIRNFGIYPVAGKEADFYNRLRSVVQAAGMDMQTLTVPTGFRESGTSWTNTASFMQRFRGLTDQITWSTTASNSNRVGTANYTQLIRDADMKTAQAAAAYLLALGNGDRYQKDEYDAVVAALRGTSLKFDPAAQNAEVSLRKAVGLIVTLPSYQLQ
jgi:uncharacterized protein (DUF1800 family)